MTTRWTTRTLVVLLLGMTLAFTGCGDDDDNDNLTTPENPQNNFPTIQGITIDPNAPIFVEDTVTLAPVTSDPDNDLIRYTWMKNAGIFDPAAAVGESINWTAPGTRGTYQVIVVGDDGNGGTSQKHLDLIVYGGNQSGTVDVVGGVRVNPVGTGNLGYVDAGDVIMLIWDGASPVTTDSTRPDETKYAPDGSRLDAATLTVVSTPQFGYAEGLPARDAARYSVIGRIGDDGDWFAFNPGPDTDSDGLPDSFSVPAPARGKLYLSINEQESLLADNTGFWRMSFTLTHP
ncbi:hypothetical protein GF339_14150 [candidate division KSB3 bacterium]|uniref:PKD/Chitinase domain-containing protein n=1 Tax=candidate division KSB3 bacterium TaxID=2044937 RepID=A0A9D5Q6D3_9BACT|nr:hypothetical protein [candidate division KSB3 bacterium]MBD3325724.1 hypothetical protein [candidate division KSB3 bacterium]